MEDLAPPEGQAAANAASIRFHAGQRVSLM
jgi:hypothetical protein